MSNVDIHPRILSLCSGIGGLDLGIGLALPGARAVCFVERSTRSAKSWRLAWNKGRLSALLFTRICEPSMADRGVAGWISSLPVTHASPSPSPAVGLGRKTSATSGPRSSASLARWDRASSSWRMSQATFGWDSTEFSETLPTSGSMRSGALYGRPALERPTDESGYSCWPTATMMDGLRAGKEEDYEEWKKARDRHAAKGVNKHFHLNAASSKWARQWPTPRAMTGGAESAERKKELGRTASGGGDLQSAARNWPTPAACVPQDGEDPEVWIQRREALEGEEEERQRSGSTPDDCGRGIHGEWPPGPDADWEAIPQHLWPAAEPSLRGVADGLPGRVDRLRALGNAVVPQQAAHAFRGLLMRAFSNSPD